MRILLAGRSGQIGGELARLLPSIGELVALDRGGLDLSDFAAIRRVVRELRPQLIVNAAAYTAVDQAESDEAAARLANAEGPAVMAEEAQAVGAAFVHFSTDYVFDGSKRSPYSEDDPPNPINVYGRTKLAGENAIRSSGVDHLIFRTSWIYAARGRNFLQTILRLACQREELRIVNDQTGTPTWSREVAAATVAVLESFRKTQDGPLHFGGLAGIYHITCSGFTTWYDFARSILDEASRAPQSSSWLAETTGGRPAIVRTVTPISTSEYPAPARRPLYSVLSNARLHRVFGILLPDWRVALQKVFASPD